MEFLGEVIVHPHGRGKSANFGRIFHIFRVFLPKDGFFEHEFAIFRWFFRILSENLNQLYEKTRFLDCLSEKLLF